MKAIKPKTINSCYRKLCPFVGHDFTGFTTEPIEEITKEIVDRVNNNNKKRWGFKIRVLEKLKELADPTPEERIEGDCMEVRAS